MSVTKPKIVVRAAASTSSAPLRPAMPKASATIVVAAPKASKPAPAKKTVQKVVYVEEEVEEEVLSPAQIIASLEQQLASLRTALKVKGLKKDGTPRAKREYVASEGQATWNNYVQEVREEHGYLEDEEGNAVLDKSGQPKLALSYKDAMTIASARRKSGDPSAPPAAAPAPKAAAKTVVAPPKKTVAASSASAMTAAAVKPFAASSAPVRKTAAELKAEFLAKKAAQAAEAEALAAAAAAEEEAAPEEAEEESSEAVEWEFEGQTYFKTGDNLCWLQTEDGDRIWAGVFLPAENRIDDSVAEPSFDE